MKVIARVWVQTSNQKCVSWHLDNDAMSGAGPTIALVSLGATRRFDLRQRVINQTVKVDLEIVSLLVMSGLSQRC